MVVHLSTVAIVGRPNVGKSTLFNRLTAARTAIEAKIPGVTRDRLYGVVEWGGRELLLIDTGGITFGRDGDLPGRVRRQVELAVAEAALIIFLLDGREGLTALDEEIAALLRRSGKPVQPVVNKADYLEMETTFHSFYRLGFGEPCPVSAAHGRGTGDLLDLIFSQLPEPGPAEEVPAGDRVRVAVIGRPNVGKSQLINTLLGEERLIVSPEAGTTRDAVDTYFTHEGTDYVLIDTAGIRRKSKVKDDVEYYSVLRSLKALRRADLALLMLDGTEGITEQDQRLAGHVDQAGRGLILAVNKWDLISDRGQAREEFLIALKRKFSFVPYASAAFISALTSRRLKTLFPLINQAWHEQYKRVPTAILNDLLADALAVNPPSPVKKRSVKIFYVTQPAVRPPTFVFFVNDPALIHFSYQRYLENRLREAFGFKGTPILIKFKKRERRGD